MYENLASSLPRQKIAEIPYWAVPSKGEACLVPAGDTIYNHPPADLTNRRYFRIGRAPESDIPLFHDTSSRSHAILFHDPLGNCYVTDCRSSHGTFVDGKRVRPFPHRPLKLRRGGVIRFGDRDAPSFILKKFRMEFKDMIRYLDGITDALVRECRAVDDRSEIDTSCDGCSGREKRDDVLTSIRQDGGGEAFISDGSEAPDAALLLLNTRINALGSGGLYTHERKNILTRAKRKFCDLSCDFSSTSLNYDSELRGKKIKGLSPDGPTKKIKSVIVSNASPVSVAVGWNRNCYDYIEGPPHFLAPPSLGLETTREKFPKKQVTFSEVTRHFFYDRFR